MASICPENDTFSQWKFLKVVKLLQFISSIFGLSVPGLYNYTGLNVLYIVYVTLICIAHSAIWILFTLKRGSTLYPKFVLSAIILDPYVISATALTNLIARINSIFVKRKKIVLLVETLNRLEKKIQHKLQIEVGYSERGMTFQFISFQLFVCIITLYDCFITVVAFGFDINSILILTIYYFQNISVTLVIMQIHFYSVHIRSLIQVLHKGIQETLHRHSVLTRQRTKCIQPETIFFLKMLDQLCDTVDMISDSYGQQMFIIIVTIILNILHGSNILVKIFLGKLVYGECNHYLLLGDVFNIVEYIIFGIIFSATCDKTITKAKETSYISYKILMNYPLNPRTTQEKLIKKELFLLADHVSRREITFSAGIFTVNYTMPFKIFIAIATYLIILQFE